MSLARSASGPAGLTINTGAANSLSQPASSGGLFGSTATSAATPNATASTTAAGTTGTSTATAGNMFGSTSATQSSAAPGTGLFGAAKPAAATGTSLFGGGAAAAGTTQQNTGAATTGSGLFGSAPQTNTQAPAASGGGGGGLFGASQAPAAGGGGGLFGASQAAKPTGGLFGASQAQTQQQQQQPQQQQPQQVAAVQINYDNLRPRSRFDDLAKPVQDEIALIDKGIARVIKMRDEIGEFMPRHEGDIAQLGRDVGFVESKFRTVQVALNRDIQTVKALQDLTKKNISDAQLSFKATDNLKLPSHYHQTGLFATQAAPSGGGGSGGAGGGGDASTTHADAQDLITYFNRICDDVERYKKRLDEYRDEIERDMPGVENGLYEQIRTLRDRHLGSSGGNGDSVSDQLGQVLLALREMGTAIVNQAGQIADTRERLSRLQAGILDTGIYGTTIAA